jgi:hypothetical protein
LIDAGLKRELIKQSTILRLEVKVREDKDGELTWSKEPTESENKEWLKWSTFCGRYFAARFKRGDETYFGASYSIKGNGKSDGSCFNEVGGNYPVHYSSLDGALLAVEKFHCIKKKRETVRTNRQSVVNTYHELYPGTKPQKVLHRISTDSVINLGDTEESITTIPSQEPKKGSNQEQKEGGHKRVDVIGYNLGKLCHWMGMNGWSYAQAVLVFNHFGTEYVEATVRKRLSCGKANKWGSPADVSPEHEKMFNEIRNK